MLLISVKALYACYVTANNHSKPNHVCKNLLESVPYVPQSDEYVLEEGQVRDKGAVPSEAKAIQIAEAALTSIYGEKVIETERPFRAHLLHLRDDPSSHVWDVRGSLHFFGDWIPDWLPDWLSNFLGVEQYDIYPWLGISLPCGGVGEVKISKETGSILEVTHGR